MKLFLEDRIFTVGKIHTVLPKHGLQIPKSFKISKIFLFNLEFFHLELTDSII